MPWQSRLALDPIVVVIGVVMAAAVVVMVSGEDGSERRGADFCLCARRHSWQGAGIEAENVWNSA